MDRSYPGICVYADSTNIYEHVIEAFGVASDLLLRVLDLDKGEC